MTSLDNIPNGFIGKTIPSTKYLHYKSHGKIPECVVATWETIWHSSIERKYIADFDIYGQDSQNTENAKVDTFVSV